MISEFKIAEDYNRMDLVRDYYAHQGKVTGLRFTKDNNWILSVSKDR